MHRQCVPGSIFSLPVIKEKESPGNEAPLGSNIYAALRAF